MSHFTFNKYDILDDPSINLVVELIDDAEEAFNIVKTALTSGKNVVTANKNMIANHFKELVDLQYLSFTRLLQVPVSLSSGTWKNTMTTNCFTHCEAY